MLGCQYTDLVPPDSNILSRCFHLILIVVVVHSPPVLSSLTSAGRTSSRSSTRSSSTTGNDSLEAYEEVIRIEIVSSDFELSRLLKGNLPSQDEEIGIENGFRGGFDAVEQLIDA